MNALVLGARIVFGVWMLANGVNYFFLPLYPGPVATEPMAAQLMDALVNSGLLDVAMAVQLAAGGFILSGVFAPAALCVVMPITACAVYWAVGLERAPMGAVLALLALALNGLLMLAYLDHYRGMLRRRTASAGEAEPGAPGAEANFDALFADPRGRTARRHFIPALAALLAAAAFYAFAVPSMIAEYCMVFLIVPFVILHARRLRGMGLPGMLALAPGLLLAATAWLRLRTYGSPLETPVSLVTLAVCAAFVLWCALGRDRPGAGSRAA